MIDERDDRLIDQFLEGELSDADRQVFEQRLRTDPELAEALALRRDMDQFLERRERRESLRRQLHQLGEQHFARPVPVVRPLWRRPGLAIAAAVALLVAMVAVWRLSMAPSLYEQYARHAPLALTEKSGAGPDLSATEQAFNRGDYGRAYAGLQDYLARQPTDTLARFYLAISALETGRYAEADSLLQPLRASPEWRDYADWYRALGLLRQRRTAEARAALDAIPEASPYYEQARELLGKLE